MKVRTFLAVFSEGEQSRIEQARNRRDLDQSISPFIADPDVRGRSFGMGFCNG
jgi:hypothetical protein